MSATSNPYNSRPGVVSWIGVADVTALQRAAVERILDAATRAIEQRGQFLIVLAGGGTPQNIYRALCSVETDWSRWHVYFGDERCLPADDPERNSRMAANALLDNVSIPRNRVREIQAERGAETAAGLYSNTLRGVGHFDLVLLGLGEDGHTASLFPGHDWGIAPVAPDALAVFDAPKPPSQRVSLSANRLSRARAVLFLVAGETKRDAVTQWREGANIPARAILSDAGIDVMVEAKLLSAPVG
jgi:6-phosphogluconolactonase